MPTTCRSFSTIMVPARYNNNKEFLTSSSSSSQLYNVPPPGIDADASTLKEASDRESPPSSFYELQINSARAAELAIRDGYRLIEVEFPPLPAQVLEMDDVSAYDVAEANLKLAIDFAKSFAAKTNTESSSTVVDSTTASTDSELDSNYSSNNNAKIVKLPRKVAIMLPDESEYKIAIENLGNTANPYPGVTVSALRRSDPRDERFFKPEQVFMSLMGNKSGGIIQPIDGVDMYVCIVASAQELPDIEELYDLLGDDKIICFYNLKLDVLRGDLGAPAFPPREFQDRFLSKVKPVYYLRTRQYSRSTAQPPFMVNYQGCLFRSYPGQFQTLLDTGTGKYRRVKGNDVRPALGEFKEELTDALRDEGIIQKEGNVLNFLRTGYKTTTWWEEERDDASDSWKT
eukprot:CAMPEP_0184867106 /NCGR_PEP_ID=MMETSP0580-20130426/25047_1 /TAXON_ID=1118495 /ORGANISM="Dactyliosolen fragilissimus" /LENGTH=400 /DNA_ID=CAMNT_0027367155 /DNA_START=90 /DNA_END=1292 /DNA_ORIENTATION=-